MEENKEEDCDVTRDQWILNNIDEDSKLDARNDPAISLAAQLRDSHLREINTLKS